MIKSINDIYRQRICELDSADKVTNYLKKLPENKTKYIIDLLFADLQKIKIYNTFVFSKYDELQNIIKYGVNHIIDYQDPNKVFEECISATKDFYNMDLISKTALMKILYMNYDNCTINQRNIYMLDNICYIFQHDLELYKEYYLDYIEKNKDDDYFAIDFLVDKICELREIHFEKYIKFILEFLKGFYKNCLYEGEELNKIYISYLEQIENVSINDILKNISGDDEFLSSILEGYLRYSISDEKQMIDEFAHNNVPENIQKKLKL